MEKQLLLVAVLVAAVCVLAVAGLGPGLAFALGALALAGIVAYFKWSGPRTGRRR